MNLWSIWDHETGRYYGAWEGHDGFDAVARLEDGSNLASNDVSKNWYVRQHQQDDHCRQMPRPPLAEMKIAKLGSFMIWSDKP